MDNKIQKLNDAQEKLQGAGIATDIDNSVLDDMIEETGGKRIYTSYYARCGNNENAVSISASPPSYFYGKHIKTLAPSWDILNAYKSGEIDEDQYARRYIELLESKGLTPEAVYNSIPHRTILLCYEKAGEFCHRRILAKWLEDNLNVTIEEWQSEEELKQERIVDSLLDF